MQDANGGNGEVRFVLVPCSADVLTEKTFSKDRSFYRAGSLKACSVMLMSLMRLVLSSKYKNHYEKAGREKDL